MRLSQRRPIKPSQDMLQRRTFALGQATHVSCKSGRHLLGRSNVLKERQLGIERDIVRRLVFGDSVTPAFGRLGKSLCRWGRVSREEIGPVEILRLLHELGRDAAMCDVLGLWLP